MPIRPLSVLRLLLVTVVLGPACGGGGGSGGGNVLLVSQSVDSTGGTVTVTDPTSPLLGTQVVIPPGALAAPTTITIHQIPNGGPYPSNVLNVEFGPEGTVFVAPVTVTLKYLLLYLTDNAIADTTTLHVVQKSGNAAPETLQTLSRDDVNYTVTAQTSHFSSFAVLGYSNASLSGVYTFCSYLFDNAPENSMVAVNVPSTPFSGNLNVPIVPTGFTSDSGTATFNGSGSFTYTETTSLDGVTTSDSGSATYSVTAGGVLTIGNLTGGVLSGGSAFILAATSGPPQVLVGIKKSGTYSLASLTGDYFYCSYFFDNTPETSIVPLTVNSTPFSTNLNVPIIPTGYTSDSGTLTFDGAGNFTYTETTSQDGATVGDAGAGTYTITSGGTLTTGNLVGSVLPGGSMFVIAATSGPPQLLIGIKKSGTYSNASLTGTYSYGSYMFDNAPESSNPLLSIPSTPFTNNLNVPIVPTGYTSDSGTLIFDGAGNFTYTETTSQDGATVGDAGAGTYSITSGGTLTIGTLTGGVLPGGSVFILAATSGPPQLLMGVLRQ